MDEWFVVLFWSGPIGLGVFFAGLGVLFWGISKSKRAESDIDRAQRKDRSTGSD